MRAIAARIGMSVAGLYRHFEDKEALFSTLVEPAVCTMQTWYQTHKTADYELLERNDLDGMWESDADINMMIEVVYPNFEAFKLLICRSEGTRYANFIHEMVLLEQRETEDFMHAAKAKGFSVKGLPTEELHLLLSAYVTALFEVVIHDFSLEQATHYLQTCKAFFYPGWRTVLGL